MKNKITYLIFLLFLPIFMNALQKIHEDEYIVKAGDTFALQILSGTVKDTLIAVLPEGKVPLFPFASSADVAGKTLHEAKEIIKSSLLANLHNSSINVELATMSPFHYHITGAVVKPGTYVSEKILTLDQVLYLAKGLSPIGSKIISITRNNKKMVFDLNKYLKEGDISQNPYVMDNDIINAQFSEKYVIVNFTKNNINNSLPDTLKIREFIEIDANDKTIADITKKLSYKYTESNFTSFKVLRNNSILQANADFEIQPLDQIYIDMNENKVFVIGEVYKPGQFVYNPNFSVENYIALAGGRLKNTSKKIHIISLDGKRKIYKKGMQIKPNDKIEVKRDWVETFNKYATPVVTVTSLIITYLTITK